MKQAIVLRKDLKLSAGKAIAQACHASLNAYKKSSFFNRKIWETQGEKKVVLQVKNEEELIRILNLAKSEKLPVTLIKDAGLTEIPAGTKTAVAIGPAANEKIDNIVGTLKLY